MQVKIVGGGIVSPGVEMAVDPTFLAARVAIKPAEYAQNGQILGHYRQAASTAAILAGANAVLFSLRWADPSRYFVLMRLSASVTTVAAITAQRTDPLVATV